MKSETIRWFYRPVALMGDAIAVALALFCAYQARFEWDQVKNVFPITKGTPGLVDYLPFLPAMIVLWIFVLTHQKCYRQLNVSLLDEFVRLLKVSGLASLFVMAATFLYRGTDLSRLTVGLMGFGGAIFLFLWRETLKVIRMNFVGKQPRRILILGHGRLANSLEKFLTRRKDSAILKKKYENNDTLVRIIERSRIREVLVADPQINHREAVALAIACEERGVQCRIVPDILEIRMGEVSIDDSLGIPTFQLKPIPLCHDTFLGKRVFDCLMATFILTVLSVPLLIISFLIKLDSPGPILFKQQRMGHKGRTFSFFKLRTMVKNAEELFLELKKKNERGGPVFKMKNDPRITRVGKFLRRYSLDEIPQLINVLRGDMSLVGPRPQVLWEASAYDEWAKKRLSILPGVTGLWQVSGRADLTYQEMIDLDIYYLEHWSPGLDLKILLRTLPTVLGGYGAY
jgi:exopolysaccharide biosynthesis polyprenyl glycosylphosphotransferase